MKTERFNEKLNDLLDLAKPKAGKKGSISIAEMVSELIGCAFVLSADATTETLARSGYTDGDGHANLLEKCGKTFSEYAHHHRDKGTPESHTKALRNEALAIECYRAIDADVLAEAELELIGRSDGRTTADDAATVFRATIEAASTAALNNGVDHDLIMGDLLLQVGEIGRDHGWSDEHHIGLTFAKDGPATKVTWSLPSPSTPDPLPSTPDDLDILAMLRSRSAVARKKGATEAANTIDAVLRDIDQGLHERPIDFESFMRSWIEDIAARNKAAGWWTNLRTGEPLDRNVGELLMLVTSEVVEAFEGHRKSKPGAIVMDDHLPHRRAFEVEIADVFIRLGDLSGNLVDSDGAPYDVAGAITEKLAYNAQRADHKVENRVKPGGKEL